MFLDILNFKSKPKNNLFAPEWNNFMVETNIDNVNIKKLSSFLKKKEKEILKLKKTSDGFTGLKNHTTNRYNITKKR